MSHAPYIMVSNQQHQQQQQQQQQQRQQQPTQQRVMRLSAVKESAEKQYSGKSPYRQFDQENSFTRTQQHQTQQSGEKMNISLSYNSQTQQDKAYLNQQSRDLLAEIQESQHRLTISEMQDKIVMLLTENERLQRMLSERDQDTHKQISYQQQSKSQQEDKLRLLEGKTTKLIYENEKVVLLNESLTQQIESLHATLQQVKVKYQLENEKVLVQIKTHYERLLVDQEERFQIEMNRQAEELLYNHTDKMRHFSEEVEATRQETRIQENMGQELINQNHALIHQAKQMHLNLIQAEEKIQYYQTQLEALVQENVQANLLTDISAQDLSQIKIDLDKTLQALDDKAKKENILQSTIQQFQSQIQQYQTRINKQQEEINKLVSHLNEQNDHHIQVQKNQTNQVHVEQDRNKSLQAKMELLLVENSNLNFTFTDRMNELELCKQKMIGLQNQTNSQLEQQVKNFDIKYKELQTSMKNHFKEIIQQKEREILNLNERINLLINQLDIVSLENNKFKTLYQETQNENDQIKPKMAALQRELEKQRSTTQTKEDDVERLRQQIVKLQNNHELQQQEDHSSMIKLQRQFDDQSDEISLLKQQRQELKLTVDEQGSNINKLQSTLYENLNKYQHLEQQFEMEHTELAELRALKSQLGQIKSTQRQELDNLKQQYEQAIRVRVQKELSIENERQKKYQSIWDSDKQNMEHRIQSLVNENDILKQDINQLNQNYKKQVTNIQQSQNKQLQDVNAAYSQELKGLSEIQQIQYNGIIQNLHNTMQILSEENNHLKQVITQVQVGADNKNSIIFGLEDKITALKRDIYRLIDEKANELSKNTQLETHLRRLTPQRNKDHKRMTYSRDQMRNF